MLTYKEAGIKRAGTRIAITLHEDRRKHRFYWTTKMLEGEKVGSAVVLSPRQGFTSVNAQFVAKRTDIWLHNGVLALGGWQCDRKSCNRRFAEYAKVCPHCGGHISAIRYEDVPLEQILQLAGAHLDKAEDALRRIWVVKAGGSGLVAKSKAAGAGPLDLVPDWAKPLAAAADSKDSDITVEKPEEEKSDEILIPLILPPPEGEKNEKEGKVAVLSLAEAAKLFTLIRG